MSKPDNTVDSLCQEEKHLPEHHAQRARSGNGNANAVVPGGASPVRLACHINYRRPEGPAIGAIQDRGRFLKAPRKKNKNETAASVFQAPRCVLLAASSLSGRRGGTFVEGCTAPTLKSPSPQNRCAHALLFSITVFYIAVKFGLLTECKCHGVSGSCTMKTCWKSLPAFSQVGAYLVQRYQRARRAAPFYGRSRPHEPSTLRRRPAYLRLRKGRGPRTPGAGRPAAHGVARPKPRDLVYLHESPSYCERDPGRGSAGTVGRLCNRTSTGSDGCRLLCCGRGYDTHRRTRVWQCQCKFHWCCFVRCQTCSERTEEHTCK
ncbi:protein wingless, putative [Ixodes scapularis]|uniref:Protein Wnt n=1 Tax=Ixodes scapularis TaxID=6945 RepID=B7QGH6_IXOSC|nr:protein wingless, putative [Ixodes scapularis]|eukprot:XP_002401806.1 protein wingless, putative [Ixodes scapularis]